MPNAMQPTAAAENTEKQQAKKSVVEVFMKGCRRGFYIGCDQILPAMILGYVIIQMLKLTGVIPLLSSVFGPVMGLFGLPGISIVVLISAFFTKAAGAASAASLYTEGVLTAAQCTILIMPCMLMGTLIGHFARIILVSGVNTKHRTWMLAVPIFDSIIGMLMMRGILTITGLM